MRAERHFPEIERIPVDAARRRGASGAGLFVDVRRADAYAAGHLPGAISAPARILVARAHALPRGRDLILY